MTDIDREDRSLTREELEARRVEQPRLALDIDGDAARIAQDAAVSDARRLGLAIAGSGSKGNAAFVHDRSSGESILIDAGICKRDVFATSDRAGIDLQRLRGVFISHSHSDHVKNIGVILRGLRTKSIEPTLFMHERTLAASKELQTVAETNQVQFIEEGRSIEFDALKVNFLPTSHDTEVSFGFRIDAGDDSLGYITDTGMMLLDALEGLRGVRILGLESNHDVTMLKNGPYPRVLQERVASDRGHLSNEQAADVLASFLRHPDSSSLETVVALHISENNNTYRLPVETLRAVVARAGSDVQVTCAYQKRSVFIV